MKLFTRLARKAREIHPNTAPIRVSNTKEWRSGRLSRVEATVGAKKIWFESDTTPLTARGEAWACAFYFTALKSRRPLFLPGEIDVQLLSNLASVRTYAKLWWGFEGGSILAVPGAPLAQGPRGSNGLFFTGGVDSFHSLRRRLDEVRYLINVEGFDIKLSDSERLDQNRVLIDRVASELGLEVIRVRTNLRDSIEFNRLTWEITHVAALAAVGHLLTSVLSKIYLASSDVPPPWGSHPDLDRLWSSSRLAIENDGSEATRLEKVSAIRDWDLVDRSLKVCWEKRTKDLNCGFCEKCVRTQAQFLASGMERPLSAFPQGNLISRIDHLPFVKHDLYKQWVEIEAQTHSEEMRRAVSALLERSRERIENHPR